MMDSAACNVIYVHRTVGHTRRDPPNISTPLDAVYTASEGTVTPESADLGGDLGQLRLAFSNVLLCESGTACVAKLFELQDTSMIDLRPTLVLIDTPFDERLADHGTRSRPSSPKSRGPSSESDRDFVVDEVYGISLLQRIVSEIHCRSLSRLVVPIPIVEGIPTTNEGSASTPSARQALRKLLDFGAVDVLTCPLRADRLSGLEVHVYRAHKEAAKEQQALLEMRRGRKRSWVGVNEGKPYAYLREAMVSGLMNGICALEVDDDLMSHIKIGVAPERREQIAAAVAQWHFCAHDFSDDELLIVAQIIFKHALAMDELERWRIPTDQLTSYLVACRAAYNNFVPYHNFRHVVDVLQATFNFLVHIGALAPFPPVQGPSTPKASVSPIASLLHPFEALTLLITAIGHDVGHPGVNNGFLVTLNAPLAQLYNDRSVLESFHCAAYSQILRRHWPSAFEDTKMRNLMISSILATDMGLHFDYMKKLGDIQEKLAVNNSTDGWNGRMLEEQRILACSLLIKCADISNVARKHDAALQWMHILSDEFSRQSSMEKELSIPSSLMSEPKKDMLSLAKAQLGFMNLFAIPLFQGVADIMPTMQYCVDELEANRVLFEAKITEEQSKQDPNLVRHIDGAFSPRTMSFAVPPAGGENNSTSNSNSSLTAALSTSAKDLFPLTDRPLVEDPEEHDGHGANGAAMPSTTFPAVADFAASDPFHCHGSGSTISNGTSFAHQRSSETSEGSKSAPYSVGDTWGDQSSSHHLHSATSTTAGTGPLPLSPSTQGTSIVSLDSRPASARVVLAGAPPPLFDGAHNKSALLTVEPRVASSTTPSEEELDSNCGGSSPGQKSMDGKVLKKKGSRFRMNGFNFFRKNKGSPPPAVPVPPPAMGVPVAELSMAGPVGQGRQ